MNPSLTIAVTPLLVRLLLDDEGVRELRERSVETKSEGLTESPSELGEALPPRWWSHASTCLCLRAHSEVPETVNLITHPQPRLV